MKFNDMQQLIRSRKTAQRFSDEPIPEGAIQRAIECAITAPNHKVTNPWRFIRVGSDLRQRFEDFYIELKSESKTRSESQEQKLRNKVGDPPELLVVSQVLDDDDFRRKEDYAAVSCAIQNLSLSLWSEGIYSKWASGSMTTHPKTYDWLEIDSHLQEIVGFIWIGYIREDYKDNPKPKRDPVQEVYRETSPATADN